MKREDRSGYSLVMHSFQGKYRAFQEAAEREFDRRDLSAFSLCLGKDYLPTEIADGLTLEAANRITALLEETGASITVVPSREVEGIRFEAKDCWPSRTVGGWRFTEVDDMILTLEPLNARNNVRQSVASCPEAMPWQIEDSFNHQHPTHDYSRHALRAAREMGERIAAALREAYPEREFIMDYLEEQVSFYQRGEDAPEHDEPSTELLPVTTYCDMCQGRKAYQLRLQTDSEFPLADWADCAECGAELLIRAGRIRKLV